ncbi:MAG: hypothetical protein IJV99_04015 [Clostridia bacterium]|nr:hypothetical protein [Clostridia bacterium]
MKTFKKLLAILLAVVCVFGCAACKKTGRVIDKNKTQLEISHFNGGYGDKWIQQVADEFEAAYANVSFEEGKKGVQVWVNNHKNTASELSAEIKQENEWIFFNEQVQYYTLAYGQDGASFLYDISDVVNGTFDIRDIAEKNGIFAMDDEGNKLGVNNIYSPVDKDIIGKFNDVQKTELKVNDKYYAIPHYEAYTGLTYDADLWNRRGYYFNGANNSIGLSEKNKETGASERHKFSLGPDGLAGTYDDGLPATYEEFLILCAEVKSTEYSPITWSGNKNNTFYITNVLNQLITDYHGAEEAIAYSFDGTVTDYVTDWGTDTWTFGGNTVSVDKPITGEKIISAANGYDVFNRAGYYYAYKLLEEIIKKGYTAADCYNGASHTNTQSNFLISTKTSKPTAMIAEGVWWTAEASGTFRSMSSGGRDSKYTAMGRDLRFMPLPKADAEHVGKTTLLESNRSYMFMRSNIPEDKVALCKLFIQFANEEERLQSFSVLTNAPKALIYDMEESQLAEMTPFGRSILEMKNAKNPVTGERMTDVLYQIANEPIYFSNESSFKRHLVIDSAEYDYDAPSTYFKYGTTKDKAPSAKKYFTSFVNAWKTQWKPLYDKAYPSAK